MAAHWCVFNTVVEDCQNVLPFAESIIDLVVFLFIGVLMLIPGHISLLII